MASVLITGTSMGIGMETALELARNGHRVYATMRTPDKAPLLAEIVASEKLPVSIHRLDVDSDTSVAEAISDIYRAGGEIDVLVNNAGVERLGHGGGNAAAIIPRMHGDQLFRCDPLPSGRAAAHAGTAQ